MPDLPEISRLDNGTAVQLAARLKHLGLDLSFIRRHTERGADSLKSALTPTRAASCSGQPAVMALRLLFCGEPMDPAATREALGDRLAIAAWDAGLLIPNEPAPFHLRTAGGLYLLSDYLDPAASSSSDAVMGAGETTAILWQSARPAERLGAVLDLGCGAGTLALLLAAHASRVLGTDINPRAIALARFNAALNNLANAEFRAGDLYEPAADQRFDLIVSQPPYYPGSGKTFLHGGARGDEIPRRVVAGVPAHLSGKGRALIFSSWPDGTGDLSLPGHDLLALTTSRRELNGAEQSLLVIEPGDGWNVSRRLAPECWGDVTSADINRLLATERGLRSRGPGRLRLTAGAKVHREGNLRLLELPLFGISPVDDELWQVITDPGAAAPHQLAEAARRGFLDWEV